MICLIALVVFGILGIFSATHRKVALEAFDCVFRKITLRKCRTKLDEKLKSQIVGKTLAKNPKAGKFLFKYFEIISWIFTILMIVSLVYSGYGAYNYIRYGNCNDPNEQFCIFNSLIDKNPLIKEQTPSCSVNGANTLATKLNVPNVANREFIGNKDAKVTVIEFGCYSCPYTRQSQKVVDKLLKEYKDKIRFTFIHYPISSHKNSMESAIASECARQQNKFWDYHELLFETDLEKADFLIYADSLNLNVDDFKKCLKMEQAMNTVNNDIKLGNQSGVYGTPTFFINKKPLVGPQSLKDFRRLIEEELK